MKPYTGRRPDSLYGAGDCHAALCTVADMKLPDIALNAATALAGAFAVLGVAMAAAALARRYRRDAPV